MQIPTSPPTQASRRDLITGQAKPRHHIASLIVQAWPDRMAVLETHLNRMPGVETHGAKDGKLVVTVEALGDGQLMELISAVEAADGVVATSLVYHQLEDTDHG